MSTNKKRRTQVDRVSDLPDSLLLHILSFLPLKKAVATSLLSKRWRPLWLFLPTLHFELTSFRNIKLSVQVVDKMLNSVDLKSVKKFVLDFRCYKPPRKTSKWINTVITSKVEHLELYLSGEAVYELPSSVFIANNLRVLKLSGVTVNTLSHVDLPFLEAFHLEDVEIPDITSLEMVLTACPFLKELVIKFSDDVVGYHRLNIGRLNHLETAEVPQSLIPLEAFSNVKCLRLCHYPEQDMWPFSDDIPMFCNLTHLECVADEWTEMLGSSSSPEPILDVPPCVSLHLKQFTLSGFRGSESESEMIRFMLKNARVLRTIYVCESFYRSEDKLRKLQKLAASLRSGSESYSGMHEQPLNASVVSHTAGTIISKHMFVLEDIKR
ncbi:FBD-associated F-box protein At3g52670-like [Neltuma alba]|uniref:FBD-associated F-box protein At3g52670-like n=1 Tax=Neltuma alba TaxID=207710 RepID=UPI0010A4DC40|nr:FBD-associated F-box protein At3g52670-like [Prosopis alba]